MEGAIGGSTRTTLLDHMAVHSTLNLGDLLRYDDIGGHASCQHRTLASILKFEPDARTLAPGTSLMDVLNGDDDERPLHHPKFPWRSFGNRLRFRRAAAIWRTPGMVGPMDNRRDALPESPPPPATEAIGRTNTGVNLAAALAAERESTITVAPSPPSLTEAGPTPETPLRVSLMSLLEEADRPSMAEGATPAAAASAMREWEASGGGPGGEDKEVEEGVGGSMQERACCVCMVRHKGAAFIPCGHTFCRACSRELWVSRGSCPLCNGFILEVLDIF